LTVGVKIQWLTLANLIHQNQTNLLNKVRNIFYGAIAHDFTKEGRAIAGDSENKVQ
jgi:hypothetical protein